MPTGFYSVARSELHFHRHVTRTLQFKLFHRLKLVY